MKHLIELDETVLDDLEVLSRLDPGEMLRATATAGAQVREALLTIEPDVLGPLAADGRPRAVLFTGMGGSGIAGDVAVAVAGRSAPVPLLAHRGHKLPGWVGPMDLVVVLSCSGETAETLSALEEAAHRGCRIVTVGAAGSTLATRCGEVKGLHLAVDAKGRMPRACLWAMTVPVLLVLDVLGLADVPRDLLERVADDLDLTAGRCGPTSELAENPAKALASQLGGSLPYLWGSSELATVVASRFAAQLAENAKYPAVAGGLTEVHHNQVVTLAGNFGALAVREEDIFRDRVEDELSWPRIQLLLLRDSVELPEVARRCEATLALGERYAVPVAEVAAEGDHPVDRLASLVAPLDFASVYLALLQGIDPTPIDPIVMLKQGDATA